MKCPGCNFVCSELRDICPKCVIDLRPHKRALGLRIVAADSSYTDLVSKARGSAKPAPEGDSSVGGMVKGIFGGVFSSPKTPSASNTRAAPQAKTEDTTWALPLHFGTIQDEVEQRYPSARLEEPLQPVSSEVEDALSLDSPAVPSSEAAASTAMEVQEPAASSSLDFEEPDASTLDALIDHILDSDPILQQLEEQLQESYTIRESASELEVSTAASEIPAYEEPTQDVQFESATRESISASTTSDSASAKPLPHTPEISSSMPVDVDVHVPPFEEAYKAVLSKRESVSEEAQHNGHLSLELPLTDQSEFSPLHVTADPELETPTQSEPEFPAPLFEQSTAQNAPPLDESATLTPQEQEPAPVLTTTPLPSGVGADRETIVLVTSDAFPSMNFSGGAFFGWVVPFSLDDASVDIGENADAREATPEEASLDMDFEASSEIAHTDVPFEAPPEPVVQDIPALVDDDLAPVEAAPLQDFSTEVVAEEQPPEPEMDLLAKAAHGTTEAATPHAQPNETALEQNTEYVDTDDCPPYRPAPLALDSHLDSFEIERSFGGTFLSLENFSVASSLDLSAVVSFSATEREQVFLLFELALDHLEGRGVELTRSDFARSEDRIIESDELESQLHKVEAAIDASSAAPTSLRGLIEQRRATSGKVRGDEDEEQTTPGIFARIFAGIVDLTVLALISIGLASIFDRGGLPAALAQYSISGLTDRHQFLFECALAIMPIVTVLYFLTCFIWSSTSLGGRMCSIVLTTEHGRSPKLSHIAVRSASIPLSFVMGGYLPLLLGYRSLPDVLAKTKIATYEDD